MGYADHQNDSRIYLQKAEAVNKQIAFFDFDGTITTKDTLLEFIKFCKGKRAFYTGFVLNAPYLLAYKAKLISNQKAKERILGYFFHNTTTAQFTAYCKDFAIQVLPKLIREKAKEEIETLKSKGFEVIVVTASAEDWVRPWTDAMQIGLIGTKLQLVKEKITGKIQDINCHGEEKVKRIKAKYKLDEYQVIHAYGDTSGDHAMLKIAHEKYYKPFRK